MTTPNIDLDDLKVQLCAEVDRRAEVIVGVSRALHAHPELGFAETYAHEVLTGALVDEGLDVSRAAYGLDTAFAAEAGTSGPTVAVVCEYDALPGLGHACGHNVIAAAGLGAGLAAAALAEVAGGRVRILGTPAEEGGGGKVFMLDAGAFDGCDAAMMVPPGACAAACPLEHSPLEERRGRRRGEIRCMRSGYGLRSQGLLDCFTEFFARWLHA